MKKSLIIAGAIIMGISFNFKIKAEVFKGNQVVQATKSWTIHFNQEVSFDDLSKHGITVVDGNGTKVDITLSLENDNKTIVVHPPTGGYGAGSTYKLIVGNKVHSKQNKNIKQESVVNFSIEKSNEDDAVTFKDVNLEKAVRDSINKPTGILYKKDVDKITYLNAQNKNIVYLDGIENLINLQQLHLTSNQIEDINPLENLSKLSYLDITDNPITDISVLTKLNNLECLNFGGNLFNMDCLKQIKSLKQVNAYWIRDLNKFFTVYDKANEIIKAIIKPGMSDLQKEKAIHDYIVLNTKYDYDNYLKNTIPDDDYSPYGMLINGTGVCNGYAYTTQLLFNMVGIKCIVVTGNANNGFWGGHAWNIVQIGGKYYQLDTTWDDPVPDKAGYVRYNYFNISDKELSKDHIWDLSYPECTDSINPDGTERSNTNVQEDKGAVITFKDHNFEQLVRSILHRSTGDIYKSDVKNITQIDYSPKEESKKIKDLSGIENFENLGHINLKDNSIENIEPLKNLKKVYDLELSNNNISNIDAVNNMIDLIVLNLRNNNISSIDALDNLTKLNYLYLDNNNIENINPLKRMTELRQLALNNNKISNIDALSNLSKLSYLRLDYNNIENVNPLAEMAELQELTLDNNKISNITSLKNLTKLKSLNLKVNPITQNDIDELKKVLGNCEILY